MSSTLCCSLESKVDSMEPQLQSLSMAPLKSPTGTTSKLAKQTLESEHSMGCAQTHTMQLRRMTGFAALRQIGCFLSLGAIWNPSAATSSTAAWSNRELAGSFKTMKSPLQMLQTLKNYVRERLPQNRVLPMTRSRLNHGSATGWPRVGHGLPKTGVWSRIG